MLKGEAGGTITSIEKISAEGGVMQMRIHLSDGDSIDFPVNDVPDTDLINNLIETALQPIEARIDEITTPPLNVTLAAANWTGAAPYIQTVIVEGVQDGDTYEIIGFTPSLDDTINAAVKESLGFITYGLTDNNSMLFVAVNDKPEVDIPIVLRRVN
jgi:hypothetical protein